MPHRASRMRGETKSHFVRLSPSRRNPYRASALPVNMSSVTEICSCFHKSLARPWAYRLQQGLLKTPNRRVAPAVSFSLLPFWCPAVRRRSQQAGSRHVAINRYGLRPVVYHGSCAVTLKLGHTMRVFFCHRKGTTHVRWAGRVCHSSLLICLYGFSEPRLPAVWHEQSAAVWPCRDE